MNTKTLFPLGDYPTSSECAAIGLELSGVDLSKRMLLKRNVWAQWTGEVRPPRKGEWYLSGAIVTAYRAHGSLSTSYHIAKLVLTAVTPANRVLVA